jgi:hypothetical protein
MNPNDRYFVFSAFDNGLWHLEDEMPVQSDGRIDLREACEWIIANVYGQGGPSVARANGREWLYLLRRRASRR